MLSNQDPLEKQMTINYPLKDQFIIEIKSKHHSKIYFFNFYPKQ